MRLICPNCDAEYEVDDAAIPEGGRDVQCSNCGHAWFQLPAEVEAAIADEEALFGESGPDLDEAPEPESLPQTPARRTLDENLMAVLREEAEREAAARRAEAAPIETQTEMPLSAPDVAAGGGLAAAAARRIARLKGADPEAAPPPEPAKPPSRRGLLPDIEEINSSLRSGAADVDAASADEPAARSGFRSGFVLSLLIAAGAAGAYAMAPKISEQIPASKGAMDGYVQTVDAGRLWLDGAMRRATAAIQGLTADSGE
ncbi:zinc-ribbon domain-containing protein [Paragemmobacter straminiformis]|uniref:Zinc-ribbon domain-containing protein n=1 Tax=Paragemmobacter straminiformis TaxID=2045119 RepID=A0A842I667_9RHOB|nr:zinc-ribbon domain-containing protein [Gemmobacter straminiformis]MBC2834903.1 zinc-ribbon domain-containing protein [Gemmobacter straminiformis]